MAMMLSTAVPARQNPAPSRQTAEWAMFLALQAGISAAVATGANAATATTTVMVVANAPCGDFGLMLGTGGSASPELFDSINPVRYRLGSVEVLGRSAERVDEPSPAQKLERVLEALRPNVTELAAAFGVSRQAIYEWKGGKPISQANLSKLDDLDLAANVFIEAGVMEPNRLMRRRFDGGKNMLDIVRGGGSASKAANALIAIIRREETQRRALDARLQGRTRAPIDGDDIGAPSLSDWS